MSTIMHNAKLPVVNGKMITFSDRKVGVLFNQELVNKYFGKCSFIYDGGSTTGTTMAAATVGRLKL